MKLPFVKMHGLGNDVIIIDERRTRYALSRAQLVHLAERRTGVGCDQILFLDPATGARAHARYRVVNADGSPAEHCGNGIRCVARYLEARGEADDSVVIEIGSQEFALSFEPETRVRVDMGCPQFSPAAIPLAAAAEAPSYATVIDGRELTFGAVSMGNPHAVFEVADVDDAEVAAIGIAVQSSTLFPQGVNVGFMQIERPTRIRLRVYERGAGETRACGTGACAAVAIGRRWGSLADRVEVELPGGLLSIEWDGNDGHPLSMIGPATYVFEGEIEL